MTERFDADDAARILQRAQDIEHSTGVIDDAGGVSPEALIDAASEVGIDPDAVRDALALERFDLEVGDQHRLDRLVGSTSVVAERAVALSVDDALAAVESWLTVAHRMRCGRQPDGSIDCRLRPGVGASMGRAAASVSGEVSIRSVQRITVEAQPLHVGASADRPRCMIRIIADRNTSRRRRLGVGSLGGVASGGTAVVGIAEAFALWPLVSVPLALGGYAIARSGSAHADKVELELVRVLAAVERNERPAGLIGRAARRAGSVVRDTVEVARSKRR